MKNILIILAIFIHLVSCNNKTKITTYEWREIDSLNNTPMLVDSSLIGCYKFGLINNHIITHDLNKSTDKHFKCYQICGDSLKLVNNFVGFGKGPYETLRATLKFLKKSNQVFYFDSPSMITVSNTYRIDANNISHLFDVTKYTKIAAPESNSIFDICPIDTTHFLVSQVHDKNALFSYYDTHKSTIIDLNLPYPEDSLKTTSYIKSLVYNGSTLKHPDQMKFIYTAHYGLFVILFDLKDDQIKNATTLFDILPSYSPNPDGYSFKSNKDCLGGVVSTVSSRYIYLVSLDYKTATGNEVMVFDWDGNPIRKLILDKDVSYIEVDEKDNLLYAFIRSSADNDEQLVKFEL